MKKYILGGLFTLVGILNFTNATNITFNGNEEDFTYTPGSFTTNKPINEYTITDYSCQNECGIELQYRENGNYIGSCFIESNNGNISNGCTSYDYQGEFLVYGLANGVFNSITFDDGETPANIIQGGISAFSGIIDRLGGIFGEFGPYIIYIAIACLGISLLFKALKYILGFTNNSAKNSIGGRTEMKERRNRRRRNRRLQRYIYRNERRKGGETYGQYYKRTRVNNKPKFGSRGYNSWRD